MVQSYLEGVKIGVWQLAQASEALQAAREALGQAHGLLQDLAETTQTLKPLREQVAQHKQLQVLSQLLPRLWAGECAGALGLSPSTVSQYMPITDQRASPLDGRDTPGTSQRVTQVSDGRGIWIQISSCWDCQACVVGLRAETQSSGSDRPGCKVIEMIP